MTFDRLAPHYRWLELFLAQEKLQRCRTAFLPELAEARSLLLLGEGNGRFLQQLLQANPRAEVTVLDSSLRMLELARRRSFRSREASVRFVHADALTWTPPLQTFDGIVANFFFDCFRPEQVASLLSRLRLATTPAARWSIADFQIPSGGLKAWRARSVVALMYLFFRLVTRLPARHLPPMTSLLEEIGLRRLRRRTAEWDLLSVELWSRDLHPSCSSSVNR